MQIKILPEDNPINLNLFSCRYRYEKLDHIGRKQSNSGSFGPQQCLSSITNGHASILVDTSAGFMWKPLQKNLELLKINRISLLILTHSHFDHAANAAKIKEKYNARVIIHKSEASYLTTGDNILPAGTNPFSRFLVRTFANKFRSFALYEPCKPDIIFDDIYDLSDFGFNAYLIPHYAGPSKAQVRNEGSSP